MNDESVLADIEEQVSAELPGRAVIGEELPDAPGESGWTWVVAGHVAARPAPA